MLLSNVFNCSQYMASENNRKEHRVRYNEIRFSFKY